MNVMLAAGGYNWTVIPLEKRDRYMDALESASVEHALFLILNNSRLQCPSQPFFGQFPQA
jgi:hypothetical protein